MDESTIDELAPGATRRYEDSLRDAARIRAVPQHERLCIGLEDGWERYLERYKYQPLTKAGQIRILRLHPWDTGLKTDDGNWMPRCELFTVSLNDLPEYVAISYTWGKLDEYAPVLIDNKYCLTVTKTLFGALTRLSSDQTLDFWADQLCINQYDLTERSQQVQLMSRIFEQSLITYIWLGHGDETSNAAFDLIRILDGCELDIGDVIDMYYHGSFEDVQKSLISSMDDVEKWDAALEGLIQVSLRPWFSRLWTLQELVVSKDVKFICGKDHCSYASILRAFYVAGTWRKGHMTRISNIELSATSRGRHRQGRRHHLLDILLETSEVYYECMDPKDRIYAVLALQNEDGRCNITVDYDQTVQSLYLEVAKKLVQSTQSLRILHWRRFGVLENLPTWVPQWHVRSDHYRIDPLNDKFHCCRGNQHILEESPPDELVIRGHIIARVAKTSAHRFSEHEADLRNGDFRRGLGASSLMPTIAHSIRHFLERGTTSNDSSSYVKWLLAATLTCGQCEDEARSVFTQGNEDDFSDVINIIMEKGIRATYTCLRRKVATMDTYPLALVPDFCRPDDLICIANGSSTPIVLRRSGGKFEFIGECYMQGVMHGEAVQWGESEGDRIILI